MLLINSDNEKPIYERLYEQIKEKIVSGEWKCSTKLPSTRQLSNDLKISRNTVEQAYQQLCAEGYLSGKLRSGYYVEKLDPVLFNIAFSAEEHDNTFQQPIKEPYRYDFRYGKLDKRHFPFKTWKKLMLQCFNEERDGIVSYGESQGGKGLRDQIAKYVGVYRGVKCRPEQIIVGAGTLHCLGLLCNILKSYTTAVGFEDPGYGKTRTVLKNFGFQICPVDVDTDGINVRQLDASGAAAVYVTPSHQFPTGCIMSIAKRLELLEWAVNKKAVIIEDDYSCHFRYNTRPIPSLQGISLLANVVYFGNFSKPLLPSLRIAFMVLPYPLLDKYRTMYGDYNTSVPYLHQRTLELFMSEGYWNRHLRQVLHIYKRKHDCLIQALNKHLGDRIEIYGKNAGLYVMVKVKSELLEKQLIEHAAGLGVRVYPVSNHWERMEQYDKKSILLGYSSLELDEIEEAVYLLRQAWFAR